MSSFGPKALAFSSPLQRLSAGYLFVLLSTFPVTTNLCPVVFFFSTVWATTDAFACSRGLRAERKRAPEREERQTQKLPETLLHQSLKQTPAAVAEVPGGTSEILLQCVTARLWLDNEIELTELQHYSFISSLQVSIRYPVLSTRKHTSNVQPSCGGG